MGSFSSSCKLCVDEDNVVDVIRNNSSYPISSDLLMDGYLRKCEKEYNVQLPNIIILLIRIFRVPKTYKILVVGDYNVGKTSIIKQYIYKQFFEHCESTMSTEIMSKRVRINHNKSFNFQLPITIDIQLWDLIGSIDRFCITKQSSYYTHSSAIIIVMDITNKSSLMRAKQWKMQFHGGTIPILLFVNKWDLILEKPSLRKVTDDELDELCLENNFIGWFRTSAKTGKNIKNGMNFVINKIMEITIK